MRCELAVNSLDYVCGFVEVDVVVLVGKCLKIEDVHGRYARAVVGRDGDRTISIIYLFNFKERGLCAVDV